MRLIDADALYKDVCNSMTTTAVVGGEWLWRKLWDAIKYAPTIELQRWIPCNEKLPDNDDFVIVTILDEHGDAPYRYSDFGWYFDRAKCWIIGAEERTDVIAWMPLPEPYREGGGE